MPPQYCIYNAMENSGNLNPPIRVGDIVCVTCPSSGECRGTVGQNTAITLEDGAGNQEEIVLRLTDSDCKDCPDGGSSASSARPSTPTTMPR